MGLLDRINRIIRGQQPTTASTADLTPLPPRPTADLKRFTVERDRRSIVEVCRRMADEDPRADAILHGIARDVARGGFSVKVSGGSRPAEARKVAELLIERLGLEEAIEDWARLTWRDGDSFLEISVDANDEIVGVTRKPTLQLHRNSDDRDQFSDPARAYWWADELWAGQEAPRDATWFADWQIIHARWDHDSEQRYGRPLFASARKAYKRVDEGELDIAVRRKTRAGMKYIHVIDGGNENDIEEYQERNKAALDNPTAPIQDFFTNRPGGISAVQGDARLAEIGDVEHHIGTFFLSSPIPMALLGYGSNLNRDVLGEQKEQYDRALDGLTDWLDKEILQPLIELQWLLKGIWPAGLKYEIVRPSRHPITAASLKAAGEAVSGLKESGVIADALLLRFLAQVLPGLDPDEALALLQQQREMQQQPPTGTSG